MGHDQTKHEVDQFLRDQIDTVLHLEALLLLWNSRPKPRSAEDMAKGLFVASAHAREILDDLARKGLIVAVSGVCYCYEPELGRDQLLASVDSTYRQELIRVTRLLHSKPSSSVGKFDRPFRVKKDGE